MKIHPETVHPGTRRFTIIKHAAENAVDLAYAKNPQATEEQRIRLAGELSWALLRLRFAVGGEAKAVIHDFKTQVESFPNKPDKM